MKAKKPQRKPNTIRFTPEALQKLDDTAARTGLSRNSVVNLLIRSYADRLVPEAIDVTLIPPNHRASPRRNPKK